MADTNVKYLDIEGLKYYDGKINAQIKAGDKALQDQIDVIDETLTELTTGENSVDNKIKDALETLTDAADQAEAGKYVKAIKQEDGKVTATFDTVKAAEVSVADANEHFEGATVEAVLAELYEQAGAGSAVTVTEVTSGLGDDILKAYKIYQGDTSVAANLKATINIPKDLVVTEGSVVKGTWTDDSFTESNDGAGKALKLVVANQTAPVYINVLDLVKDHTGGDGINISDTNVVSIVLDTTGNDTGDGKFLTLSDNGLKLNGVTTAINTAKNEVIGTDDDTKDTLTLKGLNKKIEDAAGDSKTTLTEVAADATVPATGAPKIVITKSVDETDGHLNYAITGQDLASATLLTAEETRAKAAEQEIADKIGLTGAEKSRAYTYISETQNYIGKLASNTVVSDIEALDAAVKANADAISNVIAITNNEIDAIFADNRKEETQNSGD